MSLFIFLFRFRDDDEIFSFFALIAFTQLVLYLILFELFEH